jgi:hypothetical protein
MNEPEILAKLQEFAARHGIEKVGQALRHVFGIALYDSESDINREDKDALAMIDELARLFEMPTKQSPAS